MASRIDADKVASQKIPVIQINTGGECHLDASTVQKALKALPLSDIDLLFIENVGNLICPVEFQLGEEIRVVVASVPEGDDKPYKYPGIFTAVNAVVLNKMDLAPYVDFKLDAMRKGITSMNRKAKFFQVSCRTGEGISSWADWLESQWRKAIAESHSAESIEMTNSLTILTNSCSVLRRNGPWPYTTNDSSLCYAAHALCAMRFSM